MLLDVGDSRRLRFLAIGGIGSLVVAGAAMAFALETSPQTQQGPGAGTLSPASVATAGQGGTPAPAGPAPGPPTAPRALNVVVLDPAHGGTDPGARGTGGIQESEITLEFATRARQALEQQGFQVVETRQGNENPSFDDRSAIANAKRGDLVQGMLTQHFKGSPDAAQTAAIRQLRTTAAPAIAVEVSSVVVNDRADLDHMAPGVADAVARGVVVFKPSYVMA